MSSKVFDWLKTDCQTERENKNHGFFSATMKHKIYETDIQKIYDCFCPNKKKNRFSFFPPQIYSYLEALILLIMNICLFF